MAINTSETKETSKDDGKEIRRTVLRNNVPYLQLLLLLMLC